MRLSVEADSPFYDEELAASITVFVDGKKADLGLEFEAPDGGGPGWVDVLDVEELERLEDERRANEGDGQKPIHYPPIHPAPRIRLTGNVTWIVDTDRTKGRTISRARNRCSDCGQRFQIGDKVTFDEDDQAHHAEGSGCKAEKAETLGNPEE